MNKKKNLIVRVKGGLGNQLFCYAAGKRLAIFNSANFIIDNVSGFENDIVYKRTFQLNHFNIKAKIATPAQRLEPIKNFRKRVYHFIGKYQKFENRRYIYQEKTSFDERLLNVRFNGTRYLDGYWQSEMYFSDIENTLRNELTLKEDLDEINKKILNKILTTNSVAIHFRWFDKLGSIESNNTDRNYYERAIQLVKENKSNIHFFVFSDDPVSASKVLQLPESNYTIVSHNKNEDEAYKDLWLMSKCNSIIMANSSFSWWAAWLGDYNNRLVVCPKKEINHENRITTWNFEGQLPERWIKL